MIPAAITPEAAAWAAGLAARLRLVHTSLADELPDLRRQLLCEEVSRSLKPVSPSRRAEYVLAVADHFPTWRAPPSASAPVSPRPPGVTDLVAALGAHAAGLTPDERRELDRQLVEAGIVPDAVPASSPKQLDEFWRRFGGVPTVGASLDPERAVKLLALMGEMFLALDQLAWTLWRNLDPKSPYRKEFDFGKLAGPYLAGDPEVSTDQLRAALERTRKLLAALAGAPGRAASDFATRQAQTLSPDAVEAAARVDKRGLMESLEAASWRKFRQLYESQGTAPQVEALVQQAVARAAEDLIGGRAR